MACCIGEGGDPLVIFIGGGGPWLCCMITGEIHGHGPHKVISEGFGGFRASLVLLCVDLHTGLA